MKSKFTEEELKMIAAQLRCPHGVEGVRAGINMNEKNDYLINATLDSLKFNGRHDLLEIGFGNGGHVSDLIRLNDSVRYTGIDISELMVAEARRINAKWVEKGMADFVLTDGNTIPFEMNRFDTVFSVNTIYFWEKPHHYCSEIYRVLKSGGDLILAFAAKQFLERMPFTKHGFQLYEIQEVEKLVSGRGFEPDKVRKFRKMIENPFGNEVEAEFVIMSFLRV